jgi:uncharacterized protein YcaQ
MRVHAITQSLFTQCSLQEGIQRLGFVQADPIRAPARAQDLILRHRVQDYRAGDLERRYPELDIEEDYLYAYGFLPRAVWRLLHPRVASRLSAVEKSVLKVVRRYGQMHPRELEAHLGRDRVINAWGGYSKATTQALEILHYRGLLRIARRENGIRVYEPVAAVSPEERFEPEERLRRLIRLMATIFAPVPEKTLNTRIFGYRRLGKPKATVAELFRTGELRKAAVDSVNYVWPADVDVPAAAPERVRFLAPFDPLIWDRRRFEHFWGWAYRFEAYTPVARRIRGYYAMPLLWRDAVIGWANAAVENGGLKVDVGFVGKRPQEAAFKNALEDEIGALELFLKLEEKPIEQKRNSLLREGGDYAT